MDKRVNIHLSAVNSENLRKLQEKLLASHQLDDNRLNSLANDLMGVTLLYVLQKFEGGKQANFEMIKKDLLRATSTEKSSALTQTMLDRINMIFYLMVAANLQILQSDDSWKEVESYMRKGNISNDVFTKMRELVDEDNDLKKQYKVDNRIK